MQFYDLSQLRVPGGERAEQAPSSFVTVDLVVLGPDGEATRRADKDTTATVTAGSVTLVISGGAEPIDLAEGVSISVGAGTDYLIRSAPGCNRACIRIAATEDIQKFQRDLAHNEPQRLT